MLEGASPLFQFKASKLHKTQKYGCFYGCESLIKGLHLQYITCWRKMLWERGRGVCMKRLICLALVLVLIVFAVWPEAPRSLTIQMVPAGIMPLGSSSELYNFGTGVGLSLAFRPFLLDYLGLKTGADF